MKLAFLVRRFKIPLCGTVGLAALGVVVVAPIACGSSSSSAAPAPYTDAELAAFIAKYPGAVTVTGNTATVVPRAFASNVLDADFKLPAKITKVDAAAFAGTTLAEGFVLPDRAKWNIAPAAFDEAMFTVDRYWDFSDLRAGSKVVPVEQNDEYLSFSAKYPGKLTGTTLVRGAFEAASVPADLVLPSFLTAVGNSAFREATIPATFTLPSRVTRIGTTAFALTKMPATFVLPDSVSYLGPDAFSNTDVGGSFRLPASLRQLGMDEVTKDAWTVFRWVVFPAGFTIPPTVTDMSYTAMSNAGFMEGAAIPAGTRIWSVSEGKVVASSAENVLFNARTGPGLVWSDARGAVSGSSVVPAPA